MFPVITNPPTVTPTTTDPPTATPVATPGLTPVAFSGHLGDALAYVGEGATLLWFTDWAAIRSSIGAEALTGASSPDEKRAALRVLSVSRTDTPASEAAFDSASLGNLLKQYEQWGYDVMDLDWELAIEAGSSPRVWIQRFRDGYDVGALEAKLDEYGFASETLPLGRLRTTDVGAFLSTIQSRQLIMGNTGLSADGRTVILAASQAEGTEAVRAFLTTGAPDSADASTLLAAATLEEPTSAALIIGPEWCSGYDTGLLKPDEIRAAVAAVLESAGPLAAYQTLGVGYSRAHEPIGRIVFSYLDPGDASADLAGRRLLAEDGISSVSGGTTLARYSEVLFALVDARTEGPAIVLDVAPIGDSPTRLQQMTLRRDMLFATCGP
jgi:hypothetical protein